MSDFAKELEVKTSTYFMSAMGLVAALAWNDAVKDSIDSVYPLKRDSLRAKIIYAIIITALLIILIWALPTENIANPLSRPQWFKL